jgi:NAD-dependent dihydropyrimidine dehydrogenase PreA subunit
MQIGNDQAIKPHPRIAQVIRDDMCIACGACIQSCPVGAIESTFNFERAAYEAKIENPDICQKCTICDKVCPSIEVNFSKLLYQSNHDPCIPRNGPLRSILIGYAPAYQFNGKCSSGGIIRAFIVDAIDSDLFRRQW